MRFRYILYALLVTVISTALSWGGMFKSSTNTSFGRGSTYSPGSSSGGSWGGGSGGHK